MDGPSGFRRDISFSVVESGHGDNTLKCFRAINVTVENSTKIETAIFAPNLFSSLVLSGILSSILTWVTTKSSIAGVTKMCNVQKSPFTTEMCREGAKEEAADSFQVLRFYLDFNICFLQANNHSHNKCFKKWNLHTGKHGWSLF